MKRWFAIAVAIGQVLVLAFMAGQREWVARTGRTILVRTAPIDPRDPMRGDYVRLDYEISRVPRSLCRDGVSAWFGEGLVYSRERRDQRVYAELSIDAAGLAQLVSLSDREPESGLYLCGRTEYVDTDSVRVRYGIEAFFMEQGRAWEFEREVRDEKPGVPINSVVAVSPGGMSVLKGYEWEPLGLTVEITRRDEDSATPDRRSRVIGAVATLKNHSDHPVAMVDLPEGASFRLVKSDRFGSGSHAPASPAPPQPRPRRGDIMLLQPGESREVSLDFGRPEWFVVAEKPPADEARGPVPLENLADATSAWFRIEYAPPSPEACIGLPHADAIRHARLRSRSFSPGGGLD